MPKEIQTRRGYHYTRDANGFPRIPHTDDGITLAPIIEFYPKLPLTLELRLAAKQAYTGFRQFAHEKARVARAGLYVSTFIGAGIVVGVTSSHTPRVESYGYKAPQDSSIPVLIDNTTEVKQRDNK